MNEALENRIRELDAAREQRAIDLAARLLAAGRSVEYIRDVLALVR